MSEETVSLTELEVEIMSLFVKRQIITDEAVGDVLKSLIKKLEK